ncbi:hypothetical protein Pla110_13720 [Polystyrenella longa]|uniref:Uncharacterized protein n=1 Tax=Polystyrenella longa TaxID=2528007 RepID=A0A518CKB8_9PLAN|nr:hypothetical protein [Polystyrenella longa]QDU79661.1 hypothetical protein Pla110_13720 [Polystyrenella longa]
MQLKVEPDGTLHAVYQEEIDLSSLGPLEIRRGSHVEPNANSLWEADLSPVSGPVLGPFPHRADAIQAEQAWLETFWLPAFLQV